MCLTERDDWGIVMCLFTGQIGIALLLHTRELQDTRELKQRTIMHDFEVDRKQIFFDVLPRHEHRQWADDVRGRAPDSRHFVAAKLGIGAAQLRLHCWRALVVDNGHQRACRGPRREPVARGKVLHRQSESAVVLLHLPYVWQPVRPGWHLAD